MMPERPVFGPPDRHDLHLGQRYTRWAIWGCGALGIVGILFVGGMLMVMARTPGLRRDVENLGVCSKNLTEVAGALQRYQKDKGRTPESLDELYPRYLAKRQFLHCPGDDKPAGQTSYLLKRGVLMGPGSAVVAYCPHHPLRYGLEKPGSVPSAMVLEVLQDGTLGKETMPVSKLKELGGR